MNKIRLEAFSDGVIAIIITIMVLEFKIPHEATLSALSHLLPEFISYILSFAYVGVYWFGHHHLLHSASKINGYIILANLHLLFWLSLIPFSTGWMGVNHFTNIPSAFYGVVLFMVGIAYSILKYTIVKSEGKDSVIVKTLGSNTINYISLGAYLLGIVVAFFSPVLTQIIYFGILLMWVFYLKGYEKKVPNSHKSH